MNSRDKIVIIMLQWMRLYTLGSRGSRELKTFLETRLISSRVDQKLKNKRGKYIGFKEEDWPEIVGQWRVVEAVLLGRGSDSLGRRRSFGIGHELALILPRFPLRHSHNFRRDRPRLTIIGPRSGVDRAPDSQANAD